MWHQPKRSSHTGKQQRQLVMTIEKGDRCTSPVHLHVDDATPVHVHVKKPKKPAKSALGRAVDDRLSESKAKHVGGTSSNLRRSTATAHSRSKSPGPPSGGPWVPPPGKTSKALKYSWQGPGSRLEIANPQDAENIQSTLRLSDLSTDEEDHVKGQMRQYEKKIDGLMTEVGSLKDRVSLEKTVRQMEKKDELLDTSRRALEEQEFEIDRYRHELEATEKENQILRQSLGRLQPSPDISHELLMKKLVEVEMDGQAAAKQVAALRDSIRRIKEDKNHSSSDGAMLMKQKELLMERLADFESSNRTLRSILRDRHENEADTVHLTEQRDLLLRKLSETEGMAHRYKSDLLDKDRLITDLKLQSDAQREENCAISGLQTSLESTRAHLQKQLRQKDADCNRMAVQIRGLHAELGSSHETIERLSAQSSQQQYELNAQREQHKAHTCMMQNLLTSMKDEAQKEKDAQKELQTALEQLRWETKQLKSQCASREEQVRDEKKILSSQHDAVLDNMQKQLQAAQREVEQTKHESQKVEHELSLMRKEACEQKVKCEKMSCELSAQSEVHSSELKALASQYEAKSKQMQCALDTTMGEVVAEKDVAQKLQMQLSSLRAETGRLSFEAEQQNLSHSSQTEQLKLQSQTIKDLVDAARDETERERDVRKEHEQVYQNQLMKAREKLAQEKLVHQGLQTELLQLSANYEQVLSRCEDLERIHKLETGNQAGLVETLEGQLKAAQEANNQEKCMRQEVEHELHKCQALIEQLCREIDEQKEVLNAQTMGKSEYKEHMQELLQLARREIEEDRERRKALETQLAQEKIETDHLASLLEGAKQKTQHDKEALKKATRVQKQRAARSEDAIETLNAQLLERDNYIAELRGEIDNMNSQCDKMTKEKSQIMAERAALSTRTTELENIVTRVEDGAKHEVREITAKLHEKTSDVAACKLENERLKTSLSTIEDKLAQGEGEINQLRQSLKQYETLVDEYRTQHLSVETEVHFQEAMNRSRREADETMIHLEEQKRESARIQRDGEVEIDKVKNRLQTRLQELEPIPELLRSTELRLQDANEKLLAYEKRNTENTKLIAELTSKVEHQSDQLDGFRERWHTSQDENRLFQTKHEAYDRKLRELEDQNRDLLQTCAKREEGLHQATMRLDEKTREAASFSRQLETALADARRTAEQAREKAASKERANQSRILDLEAQLSQARAELASLKREKEEAERKFNSRLYDIKDRLEQSHSTNRSMQNYVQFLKTSYANVFGDTSAIAGTSPLRGTTFPY